MVANGAPILARNLLRHRFAAAVDGNRYWSDGRRMLGDSKTWRGIAAGVAATALTAPLLGYGPLTGATVGVLALSGDLMSSFVKRRLGFPSSAMALGLDQIPESLLPALVMGGRFGLEGIDIPLLSVAFLVLGLMLSALLYLVGVRRQPY